MKYLTFILFLFSLNAAHVKAMPKNPSAVNQAAPDSLHKVWKFKTVEAVPGARGGMGSIENYDLWDLTKKDTLNYTIKDSVGVVHSVRYKIANNAIVLQFPNSENNVDVKLKISELTTNTLKLIVHLTYTMKEAVKDEDIIILIFEAESK